MRPVAGLFRLKNSCFVMGLIAALGFAPVSFTMAHAQRAGASQQAHSARPNGIAPTVTCGSGTNNWTGKAGDNQWTTATNWSSGAVPISTDNVCIASTVTTAINVGTLVSTNQTIVSLDSGGPITLAAGPLTITGSATFAAALNLSGSLTLNGVSSMTTLAQTSGTLANSSTLTVSGLLTWSGGTESGTGATNANGGMALSSEPFLNGLTLNNAGTATWNGLAFLMENGAVFNNKSGATWNHETDSSIQFEGGTTPVFNNAGTFEKTGGTTNSGGGISSSITFNNTGTVTDNSGTLFASNVGVCSGTCAGSWSVALGATLELGSGSTAAAVSGPISGAGTVAFTTGTVNYTGTYNVTGGTQATSGTANFNSPATLTSVGPINISNGTLNFVTGKTITTSSLTQTAGTLEGSDTLTVTGAITWSGGTESGTGITNANGGMTLTSEPFLSGRTLNNTGTASWNGLAFLMENGAVFNNKSGATWNHETDSSIQFEGGTTPVFNNAGTFEKTGGTNSSGGGISNSITFNNTGTVTDSSGVLFASNIGVCSGTCAGSWSVVSGATLGLGSGSTAAAVSGPISGAGTVQFTTGTVNYTGAYDVTGGTQATNGTVNFISPAKLTSVGSLNVGNGTMNFSTGKLITATSLTQSAGTLEGTDTLTVTGATTWSGGTESGTGITNANGGMTLTSEPFLSVRTINNAKIATWNGLAFLMENGAVFNNKAGATWNHETDSDIQFEGGTTPVFNNAGTFEKTGGTASSGGGFSGSITVNNSGTVIAKSGILLLGTLFTQTGGSTLLEGGNIATSGTATMTVKGGSVFGAGTITGGVTNMSGVVSASSSLISTTPGTLTVNGSGAGYYAQGTGGTVEFGVAGSSAGDYDVLTATGAATLAGSAQLCLIKGFKPTVGSTFPVMTYASETGNFSTVNFGWSLTTGATSATATYNGAPATSFVPATLAFPSTLLSTTSSPLTLTLSNPGTVSMSITSFALTGTNASDFAIVSNLCGATLAVGAKCTIKVTFTPAALGARSAGLSVADNACMSPQIIALSGKGTEITMSPSPVGFGSEAVGTTSAPMTVTVTNHGTTAVKVTSATITGVDKGDFAITGNTCTTISASGGTCSITVTFTPAASGVRTGTLSLIDNDKGSPQTDALTGTGTT
ncbi:MAG: choice-of-anchor D domain-containing protein [Candidatus Sulfotelmatobacter sp.]